MSASVWEIGNEIAAIERLAMTVHALGNLSGNITLNAANGGYQWGTCTGATTWIFSGANVSPYATRITLEIVNGGAYAQTWPATVLFEGGIDPVLTVSGVDVLEFYTRDAGVTWQGAVSLLDIR